MARIDPADEFLYQNLRGKDYGSMMEAPGGHIPRYLLDEIIRPQMKLSGQAPGMDVWEGVGGKARPGGNIKGRGGRQRMEDRRHQLLTQNMSDDAFLNDLSGLEQGYIPEDIPMPRGYEELYSDPDWQEYDYLTDGHGNAEDFLAWKAAGKSYNPAGPDNPVNNNMDSNAPDQVLMRLMNQFGMERDYSGGNIRPTDFGDESVEFGDEGMDYPGRPAYYEPAPKGLIGGGARNHRPVWLTPHTPLPPLSPELMDYQLNNNPPNAVPTEMTYDDDQPGTRYHQDEQGRIIDSDEYRSEQDDDADYYDPNVKKYYQDIPGSPQPVEVNRAAKGNLRADQMTGAHQFESVHPKGAQAPSRENDFASALDYAVAVPKGYDYISKEEADAFMQSTEGQIAHDIWAQEGNSAPAQEQIKSLWDKWKSQSETTPELEDMNNTRIPNKSYP